MQNCLAHLFLVLLLSLMVTLLLATGPMMRVLNLIAVDTYYGFHYHALHSVDSAHLRLGCLWFIPCFQGFSYVIVSSEVPFLYFYRLITRIIQVFRSSAPMSVIYLCHSFIISFYDIFLIFLNTRLADHTRFVCSEPIPHFACHVCLI